MKFEIYEVQNIWSLNHMKLKRHAVWNIWSLNWIKKCLNRETISKLLLFLFIIKCRPIWRKSEQTHFFWRFAPILFIIWSSPNGSLCHWRKPRQKDIFKNTKSYTNTFLCILTNSQNCTVIKMYSTNLKPVSFFI